MCVCVAERRETYAPKRLVLVLTLLLDIESQKATQKNAIKIKKKRQLKKCKKKQLKQKYLVEAKQKKLK